MLRLQACARPHPVYVGLQFTAPNSGFVHPSQVLSLPTEPQPQSQSQQKQNNLPGYLSCSNALHDLLPPLDSDLRHFPCSLQVWKRPVTLSEFLLTLLFERKCSPGGHQIISSGLVRCSGELPPQVTHLSDTVLDSPNLLYHVKHKSVDRRL